MANFFGFRGRSSGGIKKQLENFCMRQGLRSNPNPSIILEFPGTIGGMSSKSLNQLVSDPYEWVT